MNLQKFSEMCGSIELYRDAATLKRKSRDHFWFSPILSEALDHRRADLVACPLNRDELLQLVRAAVACQVPITPRGSGTGTFGQAVPMAGGVVVDMSGLNKLLWHRGSTCRAEAGIVMGALDQQLQPQGWELRIHPSTRNSATLGGFVAGGHAGIGVINYGIVRDRGNLLGLQVMTAEAEPRLLEIRGDDIETVHHAYGVNGLITEVELPLAPAWDWQDVLVSCDDFMAAARLGYALARASGILKKVVCINDWELARHLDPLSSLMPEGRPVLISMIARESVEAFTALLDEHGARLHFCGPQGSGPEQHPFFEYTWGHTTLRVIRHLPTVTNLACVFDPSCLVESIGRVHAEIGYEAHLHLEFIRFDGQINAQAVPLVPFLDREHLADLTQRIERCGARSANLHTYLLQNGGMKRIDESQLAFKRSADPCGLLNPGKIEGYADVAHVTSRAAEDIKSSGWAY